MQTPRNRSDPRLQDMDTDRRDPRQPDSDTAPDGDSSDVVAGPIGDAHLVDPTDAEALSADLEALPAIDDTEPPDGPPPDDGAR